MSFATRLTQLPWRNPLKTQEEEEEEEEEEEYKVVVS